MNIAIVDDHKLLSELIKQALAKYEIKISIAIYSTAKEFLNSTNIDNTNVLITDIMMPEMSGLELISECKKRPLLSNLAIIVLSSIIEPITIKEAISLGANAYLAKDASLNDLKEALNHVINIPKRPYIGNSLKDTLIKSNFDQHEINLSPREKCLLKLICEGNTIKEIADIENLSANTIQSYMKNLMRKMKVNRTPDLILKAIKIGLFRPKVEF